VRAALGTLPCVEVGSVQTDVGKREARFNLKDRGAFSAEETKKALRAQGFPDVTVKVAPGS
jgi:hypothetical protein